MQTQLNAAQIAALRTAGLLPTTEGFTEAKAPVAPAIPTEKANGTTPLWLVSYTSRAGETKTYGVFWSGVKDGKHRLGLKPLVAGGYRMYRYNRRNSYSHGFFVDAADTRRI